jgi:hypothetical protein
MSAQGKRGGDAGRVDADAPTVVLSVEQQRVARLLLRRAERYVATRLRLLTRSIPRASASNSLIIFGIWRHVIASDRMQSVSCSIGARKQEARHGC